MNWKNITDKLNPYIDKVKKFGKKAAEFAEEKVQEFTPLFIKTTAEYDALLAVKRSILIAYDTTDDAIASEVRLHSSVWMTRAFMDAADIKFIAINEYPELSRHANLKGPLDMRIRLGGVENHRIHTKDEMRAWWKSPVYDDGELKDDAKKDENADASPTTKTDTPADPLLSVNKK